MKTLLRNIIWGMGNLRQASLAGIAAGFLACSVNPTHASLEDYDAAITADQTGGLVPVAKLTSAVVLAGTGGAAFNFGTSSGDVTIEFILEGNPGANNSAYLGVGAKTSNSIRYEVWDNTGELGFSQAGVADYQFTPGVPSPTKPAHIAYVWDPAALAVKLYVNGQLKGTASGVDAGFAMPSGQGWLGANENGEEAMVGTIHRVTAYDSALAESVILAHADAYDANGALVDQGLASYDAAVKTDATGGLTPVTTLTNTITLTGAGGESFDFGSTADDVTMEFILTGDPSATNSSFLAVGEFTASSLRYELYDNTGQIGFTQAGVADYLFAPAVPSPIQATHITYVWNATTLTMKLYLNGTLAGTTPNVSANFSMPTGPGWLGSNPGGSEPMFGKVYRVTIYDDIIPDATILRHAKAFTDVIQPPIINSFTAATNSINVGASTVLSWQVANATKISINGTDLTGSTTLTVSPPVTTTYTITALNSFGSVSSKVTVTVNPKLDAYDAAITADMAGGLTPLARLLSAAKLNGISGVPFDFGASSGSVTMEFILEGDTSANASAYLAVGEVPGSSLRYELYNNTGQLGCTQLGVADYQFSPVVPSPAWPTHVAYVWDATALTLKVFVNGTLAGKITDVDGSFVMPAGQGWLGSNDTGGEPMMGSIFRVTIYNSILSDAAILRHANAFMSVNRPALNAYDTAITDGVGTGLTPLARLLAPVILTGDSGVSFDFGLGSGDMTMEFIVEGDPTASVASSLAMGTNTSSMIRYEVWENTGELGFTQGGVADYQFTPGVAAPKQATHVTYLWNAGTLVMKIYMNGVLAGTVSGVDATFGMPVALGTLGANIDGSEAMLGTMHRVTVYDSLLTEDVILRHAQAFANYGQPPVISVKVLAGTAAITLSQGTPGSHYRVEYRKSLSSSDPWQLLEDIPALSGTSTTVNDPTLATTQQQRFYRAGLVP
jgi:hypothetical protein